jgi:sarcosine oxidase subunit beta
MTSSDTADVVVVGGGTVGAWTAVQLAERGVGRVVLLESATLGDGASSRAAGMVRAQGGTETAVRLGLRTQEFYRSTAERFPLDCGFVEQGYLMPCFTEAEVAAAHERIALQRRVGLDVHWWSSADVDEHGTGLAPGVTLGASYAPGDGYIDAPRNVLAYTAALTAHRVQVRERCAFTGLRTAGGRVVGVDTSAGPIATEQVVLTGGPSLAEVGMLAGGRIPAGGARHQVVVTERVPSVDVYALPMVFDVASGIYWRPAEAGGMLWGMSNPDEKPGKAEHFDAVYYEHARERIETLLPAVAGLGLRRTWAATIDYTSDHTPILGPLITGDGSVSGTVVASAAGHGMMWGPAVAEAAADLVWKNECSWLDVTDLGLDRFDASGNSRLAPDPIALPFPESVAQQ